MDSNNLSGVPPSVTLSGLSAGAPSIGGTAQPGLSGAPGQGGASGFLPGMEGSMDLAQLLQMLQGSGDSGIGSAGDINQSLMAGSFGQQTGGLGASSFGQTQPGYVAGQSSAGNVQQAAQSAAAGSSDPFAIIQKILGTAQQGARLLGGGGAATASPTAGSDLTLNTDLGGLSGTGSPSAGTASPTIEQDMQGVFGGSGLQDPTLDFLFTSGKLNGLSPDDWSSLASMPPDQLAGLRTALMGGETQSDLGSQLLSGQGGAGFSLGTGEGAPDATNYLGAGMSGLGGAAGLLNLYRALEGGDATGAVGGGLQGLGGLIGVLRNMPELAGSVGLDSSLLGGAGAGVGGLGGLLSLFQGAQSGNPVQIGTGLLSALQALNTLATTTAAGTGALAASPALSAVSAALSGASAPLAAAAPVIQAIISYMQNEEEMNARSSGWWNNPIKGSLYSGATRGVGNVNDMLSLLQGGGDLSGVDTGELGRALSYGVNNLLPYYATAEGGRGAIRASDTVTGRDVDPDRGTSDPFTEGGVSPESYTQDYWRANQGVTGLVNELMRRGVTYEQLGQLPVTGDWTQQTLDAAGTPDDFIRRSPRAGEFLSEAQGLFGTLGLADYDPYRGAFGEQTEQMLGSRNLTPEAQQDFLLQQALGASMAGPEKDTKASGLYTSMYGGPLWAALARMGAGGPEMQGLIAQNFDPWVNARTPEFAQARQPGPNAQDIQNWEATTGLTWDQRPQAQAAAPQAQAPNFWQQLAQQPPQQMASPSMQAQAPVGLQAQMPPMDPAMLQQLTAMAGSPQASTAGGAMGGYNTDGRITEETLMDLLRRMSPGAAYAGV